MTQAKPNQQHMTISEYKEKIYLIIVKMLRVLIRAQRKLDDVAYRTTLKKLDKFKNE